jgi:uncharacterized coiled-coil protein SlyX
MLYQDDIAKIKPMVRKAVEELNKSATMEIATMNKQIADLQMQIKLLSAKMDHIKIELASVAKANADANQPKKEKGDAKLTPKTK